MNLRPRWRALLFVALGMTAAGGLFFVRHRVAAVFGLGSSELDSEDAEDVFPGAAFSPEAADEDLQQAARDVAAALIGAFPEALDALDVQARLYLSLGDSTRAAEVWRKCLQREPSFAAACYGLGCVAKEKGQYENAVEMFRRVADLDPSDLRAPALLGECLLKLGRMEEAVGKLERCLKKGPPTADAVTALGQAYLALGRLDDARRAFEAAARDAPKDKRPHYGLAMVYSRLGDPEESRRRMERFRALSTAGHEAYVARMRTFGDALSMRALAVEVHLESGRAYLQHGDAERAEDLWRRAAVLDPKNAACRLELAALYERAERDRDALRVCRQLHALDPRNAQYAMSIGLIHARLGRFDAAIAAAEQAVELAPDNPRYREAYEAIRRAGGNR